MVHKKNRTEIATAFINLGENAGNILLKPDFQKERLIKCPAMKNADRTEKSRCTLAGVQQLLVVCLNSP
jgi:hypothetical protein